MENSGAIIIEGHVQGLAVTRSLGKLGVPVYVIDKNNCIARYSKHCKKFFKCPDYSSDSFCEFLLELAAKENLERWVLFPSNDHAVVNISNNAPRLKNHYRFVVPEKNILDCFYNKELTVKLANELGVPTPKTYSLKNAEEIEEYPLFVRGVTGLNFYKAFGKKGFLVKNKSQLNEITKKLTIKTALENVLVQEMISYNIKEKVVFFTAFCVNGNILNHFICRRIREHPLHHGTTTYMSPETTPELFTESEKIVRHINFTGIIEFEYLRDNKDGKFKLLEANVRTFLQLKHAIRCGVNYPMIIYNFLVNDKLTPTSKYRTDINWINFYPDIFYALAGILKREYKLIDVIKSYASKNTDAVFCLNDIFPFVMETLMLPYIVAKRKIWKK